MVKVANILTSVNLGQALTRSRLKQLQSLCSIGKLTRVEKCFTLIVIILLIICLILIILSAKSDEKMDPCSSRDCINAAASLINQIDESVSPCDDFYKFACGGLDNEKVFIPDDRAETWSAMNADYELTAQLKRLLDNLNDSEPTTDNFLANMKHYYNLCMDTVTIESLQHDHLLEVLKQIGKWPVLSGPDWVESEFDMNDTLVKSSRYGFDTAFFARTSIDQTLAIPPTMYLKIGDCSTYLEATYYVNNTRNERFLSAYLNFMIQIVTILGADPTIAGEDMAKVLKLETELSSARTVHGEITHVQIMTVESLQNRVPIFDWLRYLRQIVCNDDLIDNETRVIVESESYLKEMERILIETDDRIIANYIFWRLFTSVTNTLNERFLLITRNFYRMIDGRRLRRYRPDFCASIVSNMFKYGSSYLYLSYNLEAKRKLVNFTEIIVNYTRLSFNSLIKSSTWIDPQTLEGLIRKSNQMRFSIGFAEESTNYTIINSYYQWLPNKTDLTFTLMTLHLKFWHRQNTYQLLSIQSIPIWQSFGSSMTINAYYAHTKNMVHLTMGILDALGLNQNQPMYFNFGSISWIVGHEISHSVDPLGKLFNEQGHYSDWWSNVTTINYNEKVECFVNQFNRYIVNPINLTVDGWKTLSENVADNVGLRVGFMAHKLYTRKNGPEPGLPGLTHYTPDQLFFIRSARFYCGKWSKEAVADYFRTDVHSPSQLRAIGSVSNLNEFSETFNCKPGSSMNPVNKCTLW